MRKRERKKINVGARTTDRDINFLPECISKTGHVGLVSEGGLPGSNVSRLLLTPSITGLCGCQQWFEKGVNVWMEVLWEGAKKLRLFHTKHEGERLSIYHKLSSLTFSHPTSNEATQLSSCCWKCSSVWQNVLNPHCYFMVTDIKLIMVWCVVYCIFGST